MDDELLSGKRVLVVEDEMLVAMHIEDLLTDLGCTSITLAATVESALECIAENKFDLATLDVNLDGTRSFPVAVALKDRHIPFTFATGYGDHGFGEAFVDFPVLHKPYGISDLKKVLEELSTDGVPRPLAG